MRHYSPSDGLSRKAVERYRLDGYVKPASDPHFRVIHRLMCPPLDRKLAAAMADVLDGLSVGMFLVDADGRIVHANAAGQVVLAAGDVLCCAAGRLAAPEDGANKSLAEGLLRLPATTTPRPPRCR